MKHGTIVVENVGKFYRSRNSGRPTTLKGYMLDWSAARKKEPAPEYWGLRHVSFSVSPGRSVGVVGMNGAGKSTLLRLIGDVGRPDEGAIRTSGRVGALLDIGAGLTDDLTGRENVYLLGVISGMLRSEVTEEFERIVAFAELEDHIEAPVRTYSTGMRMRLAFAVAIHTRPDILLIDEALAVGDKAFQHKCFARVSEIRATGCTIFLVSHDVAQIKALCDEVLFLESGRMVAYGPRDETLALYEATVDAKLAQATDDLAPVESDDGLLEKEVNRFGTGKMQIDTVVLHQGGREAVEVIRSGAPLSIAFTYRAIPQIENAIAVMGIYAEDDTCCYESNSLLGGRPIPLPNGELTLSMDRLDLAPGTYTVSVGLFSPDWGEVYDYHDQVYPLRVIGAKPSKGLLNPPFDWEARTLDDALAAGNGAEAGLFEKGLS